MQRDFAVPRFCEVLVTKFVTDTWDRVTRDSVVRKNLADPKVIRETRDLLRDESLHRLAAQKDTTARMKRSVARARVGMLIPIASEQFGEDERVVINAKDIVVPIFKGVLANCLHLRGVVSVIVLDRQKDFIGERLAQVTRLRRRDALVWLGDGIAESRTIKEFVVDSLGEGFEPCLALGVDTSLLVERAHVALGQPINRVIVEKIIKPMTGEYRDEQSHISSEKSRAARSWEGERPDLGCVAGAEAHEEEFTPVS